MTEHTHTSGTPSQTLVHVITLRGSDSVCLVGKPWFLKHLDDSDAHGLHTGFLITLYSDDFLVLIVLN